MSAIYDQVTTQSADAGSGRTTQDIQHNGGDHERVGDESSDVTLQDRSNVSKTPSKQDEQQQQRAQEEKEKQEDSRSHDEKEQGGNGGDEENNEGPRLPVGFWDKSLKQVRKEVYIGWARTTLILATFILAILSLYWAVLFRVNENMSNLTVAVVNFDGQVAPYTATQGLLGQAVVQAARQQAQMPTGVLGYQIRDPAEFNNDPMAVRQYVYDEHAWAAIIVNANATALLQQAVAQGNQSYDPLGAMQMIYVQARDEMTASNYIIPQLNSFATNVQSQFGQQWVSRVLSNGNLNPTTYANAPQALSPAIGASVFNLRPFVPTQATPAVTIGLIYLIIIAFFNFSFYLPSKHNLKSYPLSV